jgi:hypothetical protein
MIRRYLPHLLALIIIASTSQTYAVVYPTLTPTGETTWGAFQTYFNNMFASGTVYWDCVDTLQVVAWFDNITGAPICVTPTAAGFSLLGQTAGDTARFNGTDWIRSNFLYNNGTNIGIGNQLPTATLDVNWQIRLRGGSPALGRILMSDATGIATWYDPLPSLSGSFWAIGGNPVISMQDIGTTTNFNLPFITNGIERMRILTNGNVGIGVTNPTALLEIAGQIKINGGTPGAGKVLTSDATGLASWVTPTVATASETLALSGALVGTTNYVAKYTPTGTGINNSQIYDNGTDIGIGTAIPGAKFDIVGWDMRVNGVTVWRWGWSIATNTALGYQSLYSGITGYQNTAIGMSSLYNNTIGYNNTALGNLAWSDITIGSNNITIGYNAQVLSNTSDNQLNIWGWIYGSNGDIGIGISNPSAKLEVAGQIKITGGSAGSGKILVSDATGLASWQSSVPASSVNAANITGGVPDYITKFGSGGVGIFQSLFYETGSRIGLGNTNPGYTLDVTGTGNFIGFRLPTGAWVGKVLTSDASGVASWTTTVSGATATGITWGVADYLTKFGTGGVGIYASLFYETGSRIGLGNTNPGYTLDVTGTGNFIGFRLPTGAWVGKVLTSDASGVASWTTSISGATATGITGGTENYISKFGTGGTGLYISQIFDTGTGVGIGTASPSATLDVNWRIRLRTGSASWLYLISDATGIGNWTSLVTATSLNIGWAILGSTLYYDGTNWVPSTNIYNSGANIGIGTATPSAKLTVSGSALITGDITVQWKVITDTIVNRTVANVSISGSLLPDAASPVMYRDIGSSALPWNDLYLSNQIKIGGGSPWLGKILTSDATGLATWWYSFSGSTTASGIVWGTQNYITKFGTGGNWLYNSQLFESGTSIGIGTTNPGAKLEVAGTIKITGGSPWLGKLLISDATGLATWSPVFSGTTTASGITGGTQNYIPKFGTGGNGIVNSLLYETGGYIALGSTTPQSRFEIWSGATTTIFHTRGTNNLGVGTSALRYQTTGSANVGIGSNALKILQTGYNNTAVGFDTLAGNTQGYFNSAIWSQALENNSIWNWNTALGTDALWTNIDGGYNVAVGWQALYSNSANNNNVAIWYQALRATIADSNIGIGFSAGSGITSGTNNIIIGTNAQAQSNTASNQLNIGNWIYGSGGNIGIGQSNPVAKLDISGTIKITGGTPGLGKVLTSDASGLASWSSALSGATATGITGGTQNYLPKFGTGGVGLYISQIFDNGTNIWVGTGANLTAKFTIDSGVNNTSWLRLPRIVATTPIYSGVAAPLGVDGSGNVVVAQQGAIPVYTALGATPNAAIDTTTNPPTIGANYDKYFNINARQSFTVTDVGWNPYNCPEFDIGSVNKKATWCVETPWATYIMTAQNATSWIRYGYQIMISDRTDAPFVVRWGTYDPTQWKLMNTARTIEALWFKAITVPTNRNNWFYINPGVDENNNPISGWWNIGIGTTSPGYLLDVRGNVASTTQFLGNASDTVSAPSFSWQWDTNLGMFRPTTDTLGFTTAGTERLRIFSNGNMSIGTTTNSTKLRVEWQIMITGGTPGAGKVLTSDASGLATWETPSGGGGGSVGVCTIASVTITNSAVARTCTGMPASTAVAVTCTPNGAFSTPNTTAINCRANGTLNSVTCNTTAANTNARAYKCMWIQ